jgi:fructokinase
VEKCLVVHLNVAIHLKNFENNVALISKVGNDDLGTELLNFAVSKEIDTSLVQIGETHLTSVVKVNLDDAQNVSYKIIAPVAWDCINFDPKAEKAVANSAAFIFGSLAARSEQTFKTLKAYLKVAKFKALDINLRAPHYNLETLNYLLQEADLLKINEDELAILSKLFTQSVDFKEQVINLAHQFKIKTVCITLGSKGALLYQDDQFYNFKGFKVDVVDTIGSGDAFFAMLISDLLAQKSIPEILENACAVGALVAQKSGATPVITPKQIENLKTKYQ